VKILCEFTTVLTVTGYESKEKLLDLFSLAVFETRLNVNRKLEKIENVPFEIIDTDDNDIFEVIREEDIPDAYANTSVCGYECMYDLTDDKYFDRDV
jgi:uncharacterized protein YjaG (DUF416 family)